MAKQQVDRSADNYVVTVDLGPNYEWVAEMQWPEGQTQGGPAVLVIHPSDPDNYPAGGLSQTLLREVDFKYALDRLRGQLAASKRWANARARSQDRMTALLVDHAAGGRVTDEYLALLSRAYVGAVSQGQAKPLERLAEVTGKSAAAIKNHLWQATRKGLLERSPGRVGGRVTEKASAILKPMVPGADEMLSLADSHQKVRESADDHILVEGPPTAIGHEKPKRLEQKTGRRTSPAKRRRSET